MSGWIWVKQGLANRAPLLVGSPDRTGVRFQRIGGEEVDIAIAAPLQSRTAVRAVCTSSAPLMQMAGDGAAGHAIHGDQLHHDPGGSAAGLRPSSTCRIMAW